MHCGLIRHLGVTSLGNGALVASKHISQSTKTRRFTKRSNRVVYASIWSSSYVKYHMFGKMAKIRVTKLGTHANFIVQLDCDLGRS